MLQQDPAPHALNSKFVHFRPTDDLEDDVSLDKMDKKSKAVKRVQLRLQAAKSGYDTACHQAREAACNVSPQG